MRNHSLVVLFVWVMAALFSSVPAPHAEDAAAPSPTQAQQPARSQEIGGRLAALGKEYRALADRDADSLTEAEKQRKRELREQLRAARDQYLAFLDKLEKEPAASGGEQARRVSREDLEDVRNTSGVLKELGHGAVLLRYLVAEQRLYILLTTPDQVALAREVPVSAADLKKKIAAFRIALTNRDAGVKALGKAFHDLLIRPVAEDLRQAGAQTLMLSLDDALRYLPMAALHDGEQYLVQRYALAVYTEVPKSDLHLKQAPKADRRFFAGFGVTKPVGDLPALPGVRQELEIMRAGMPGTILLDEAFTLKSFLRVLEQAPEVVHVASHFVFNPGSERNSYLLFGDSSKLTLAELREMDISFHDVDLVTLSASETALGGGRDEQGREIEGLAVILLKQGARSVLATLWSVPDESTASFMRLFYGYRQQGRTKAEALRGAQLAFIENRVAAALNETGRGKNTDSTGPGAPSSPDHPYFWAPFILMGNWL